MKTPRRAVKKSAALTPARPSKRKAGAHRADNEMQLSYAIADCPVGRLLVASTDRGISTALLGDNDSALIADLKKRYPRAGISQAEEQGRWMRPVLAYFEGPSTLADVPTDVIATPFRKRVWNMLRSIPFGETLSYGDVARRLGQPTATRAVAQACGANPVAIVVPCHRVIGADGSLTGYRGGVARKKALLEWEQRGGKAAAKAVSSAS